MFNNNMLSEQRCNRLFFIFILLHLLVWTLVPHVVRFNLPLDAMEGTTWGHQFQWGYDKNPFMNAWLTTLALYVTQHADWGIYLFSQLSIVAAFYAVWQLGKKMLPPVYALIGVLLLEGLQYYNLHAIDFNDNTLEVGLWALTLLFFYSSVRHQKIQHWLLTGVFAGLSLMTKYYSLILFSVMFLFLLANKEARASFKHMGIYCSAMIFLILIAPHTVWLFSHDFITVHYAFNRISTDGGWFNHVYYPSLFIFQQAQAFIPVAVLLGAFFIPRTTTLQDSTPISTEKMNQQFLYFFGLGPLLLTLLIALIFGIKLRAGWAQPLFSLSGLVLMMWLNPLLSEKKLKNFAAIFALYFVLLAIGYSIALMYARAPSSANFPGKIIAAQLTESWQQQFHTPLSYVAGSRWLAGTIAFYSPHQPSVYIDWNPHVSPWINETQLKKSGAIFVWDPMEKNQIASADIQKRFPELSPITKLQFTWLRNKKMQPVEVLVAFLPPQKI